MQPRFITRYTTIAVFLCTCCLTFDVNARELELGSRPSPSNATKLTPEALQLLSDANALLEGFTPAKVTSFELTPRRTARKTMPVRTDNSRVKVKFADELQIRLDVHNQLYSKTGRTSSTISDLVNALGVTLTPVHTDSPASIDALIRRAELHSGKQQPDIAGTYWVEGDSSAVNVAAELFYTLEEVEWVMYKSLFTHPAVESDSILIQTDRNKQVNASPPAKNSIQGLGACQIQNKCKTNISITTCVELGGDFLGINSVCQVHSAKPTLSIRETNRQNENLVVGDPIGACCFEFLPCENDQTQFECLGEGGEWYQNLTCGEFDCNDPAGLDDAICCLMDKNVGCQGPDQGFNVELDCLEVNGIWFPAAAPQEGEDICEDFADCPTGVGPYYDDYNDCAEAGNHASYFTGDCYIDQTTCVQTNRQRPAPDGSPPAGCVDVALLVINGNFTVGTDAPAGPGNAYDPQICCESVYQMVPYCDPANGLNTTWDLTCASYAITYAIAGGGECSRPQDPTDPNAPDPCAAGTGPIQGIVNQPRIDMDNVGTNISITFNTPPAIPVEYSIQNNGGVKELYLAFNG
ncbi:MAG: hypothetical protein HOC21_03730, partial [Phycisphaerae bacterium]|nr:hypothetical protein [Phycisphaerae bacterium]